MAVIAHPFGMEPDCMGVLSIDSPAFSLNTYGWMVQNLSSLWFEAEYAGENRLIPGMDGRLGFPRELDQKDFSLVFYVTGAFDKDGNANTDVWAGLEDNLEELWDGAFAPVGTGDGALACTLTTPSGTDRTARVQFNPLRKTAEIEDPYLAVFTMTGIILGGRFQRS